VSVLGGLGSMWDDVKEKVGAKGRLCHVNGQIL